MDFEVRKDGTLRYAKLESIEIPFREDSNRGPRWCVKYGGREYLSEAEKGEDGWFYTYFMGVELAFRIDTQEDEVLMITAAMNNRGSQYFRPDSVGLILGIDSYMEQYPEWDNKLFPTLLRCEKTHFWGYMSSPLGKIVGIAVSEPVASWTLLYNRFFGAWGHRIFTSRLELLCSGKLPERHPVRDKLEPGERCNWHIYLYSAKSIDDSKLKAAYYTRAPMIYVDRLVLYADEVSRLLIFSILKPKLIMYDPDGFASDIVVESYKNGEWKVVIKASGRDGVYKIIAKAGGKESEALIYKRQKWSWYLLAARKGTVEAPQKMSINCESWYGLFSAYLSMKHFPDIELDGQLKITMDELLPLGFDIINAQPNIIKGRIQNTACMVGLLVDAWEAEGDIKRLDYSARLADWLIDTYQKEDGSFRNGNDIYYTSVIYIAKSILELALAEVSLQEDIWLERYKHHYNSALNAIINLKNNLDDIGTEGEHTFEDGMISCSIAQLGMMALLLPEVEREPFIHVSEKLVAKHRCLERLGIADCRNVGCTIRFWEAQYDVLIPENMISSPHGWTAWKIYGVWYLYQLTGKLDYLYDAMNTLGACMQLIDCDTGKLRWAFVIDPQISTVQWLEDREHPGKGIPTPIVMGEEYVEMISNWYRAPEGKCVFGCLGAGWDMDTDQGGCCDNDVHECFKALEEVALTSAYVFEEEGTIKTFNCIAESLEGVLRVTPVEDIVSSVHFNLTEEASVVVCFSVNTVYEKVRLGFVKCGEKNNNKRRT